MESWEIEKRAELDSLVGCTIASYHWQGTGSGDLSITFIDGTIIYLGANGDDMSHLEFDVEKKQNNEQ